MDQKELQEKIVLYYSKLPPDVQALFSSMSWLVTLKTISQKYGLSEKQIETLGTETTLALLGIVSLIDYEKTLTNELALQREFTEKILLEIEESIIKTIRPQLVIAFEANKNSEIREGSKIEPKLDARFEKLPLETRNIITQSNYRAILYNIAKEYNLNVDQTGILETFTTNLVTGAIPPDEFENSLKKNIGLPSDIVGKLANDINESIFKKIREELIKNTERNKAPLSNEKVDASILNQAGIEIVPARKAYTGKESKDVLPVPEKLELTTIPTVQKFTNEIVHPVRSRPLENMATLEQPASNGIHPTKGPENSQIASFSNVIHPILTQKLSGPSRIPTTKTEYSLNNITPTSKGVGVPKPTLEVGSPTRASVAENVGTKTPVPQAPKSYPKNSDPYRLPPEE